MLDVASRPRWVKVLDQTRCIGCHACTTACKSENEVPIGVTRTYVKSVDIGTFPNARRAFQVTRCNQCEDPPCVEACPTGAMYRRPDGIVDFDKRVCIGCKACMAACPYDAIFVNPDDHSAEKCNFCAHRLDLGLEPACVVVCPVEAISVGDLADPTSKVAKLVQRSPVAVRRPEKETRPGVFYRGADGATLDPLAAVRPPGGIYAWAGQGPSGARRVAAGDPRGHNSSAAAIVSYDVPHTAPWDWRVSLYTWTKGISSGAYLAPLVLVLAGRLAWTSGLFRWAAPALALAMLALTGAILVWDLEHPTRVWMLFARPQWRSWLVRGGVIITAYGAALVAAMVAAASGSVGAEQVVAGFCLPLAALAAGYTAYLFAQARGRDLWQSQLLAPHLLAQALMVGAAALYLVGTSIGTTGVGLADLLAATAALHLFMVAGEAMPRHPTVHVHMAVAEMVHGRFAAFFWVGIALSVVAVFSPWIGPVGAVAALLGIAAHKHAYVQAGQSVPLA
ncbi:MAG: 4Fe-4S dicluster domain-containing protein [Acidimicrobiales bacterium]